MALHPQISQIHTDFLGYKRNIRENRQQQDCPKLWYFRDDEVESAEYTGNTEKIPSINESCESRFRPEIPTNCLPNLRESADKKEKSTKNTERTERIEESSSQSARICG